MTKLLSLDYQIVKKREGSSWFELPFLKELS